jgi:ABC-type branched-subunit amino acid transport system permease subunit
MKSAGLWSIILLAVILLLEVTMTGEAISALTVGISFAIIALSLTLLTGYAGEINLAPVSLGAIATIFAFHLGLSGLGLHQRITIVGILIGVAATAVIGGLIALPALRLRGLYLALATLAFGVFVSDMILADVTPHILPIFHTHFSIFTNGTLNVPKIKVGPLDLAAPKAFLTTVTVVFIVIGIGLVALRHSAYGRRLAAMKDSPAATATLGQNLVMLKLSVFVFSAAIAGLGGILMSSASISVSPNSFIIFISLTLVMLTVVGGIGNVAGALMGGILAGVGFQAITSTFQNIYSHHGGPWSFIANLSLVAPAAIGVSLGRNPSGSIGQIVEGYAPLWRAKSVLAGGILLEVAAYLLVVTKVMSNWWFVFATAIIAFALPAVGKALMPEAFAPPPPPSGSPPSSSTAPVVETSTSAAPAAAGSGPVRMVWEGGSTSGRP